MNTYDFNRSFVTFVTRNYSNQARIQIEAICHLTDRAKGTTEAYYLVASCKGEDTYGAGVLFYDPNYDFSAIFSATDYFILRVGVPYGSRQNSAGHIADFFEEVHIAPHRLDGELLSTQEAIVAATLANRPLVGQSELADPAGRYHATITYPIKTMNVNDRRNIFQIDTGPILLPDFGSQAALPVERFHWAYVAFSKPDEAYFVLQAPTSVVPNQPDSPQVSHYSRIIGQAAKNRVIAL